MMGLLLDEIWDLGDAIDELERRRSALRDQLLRLCRESGIERALHERGRLRIDRYASYRVEKPTELLRQLEFLPWHDAVLQVNGRALHKLASQHEPVRAAFDARWPTTQHEVLVLTPKRPR